MELDRLERAIEAMRASVDDLMTQRRRRTGEHREVLEAFRMIAPRPWWLRGCARRWRAVGPPRRASSGCRTTPRSYSVRLTLSARRLHDLTTSNRCCTNLRQSLVLLPRRAAENAILVARSMSPAALLDYDVRLRGVVLEEAAHRATSHRRARAVDPASATCPTSRDREQGDSIIVDGVTGKCRWSSRTSRRYSEKARLRAPAGPIPALRDARASRRRRDDRPALNPAC